MKFIDLLKSHKIYPVYAAVVLYTLTFSLVAVIAPSTADTAENTQGIHQAAKTENNGLIRFQVVRNNSSA